MRVRIKPVILLLTMLPLLVFCQEAPKDDPMTTVQHLNLERYAGKWYEIARKPFSQERDMTDVTATYTIRQDGRIDVLNQGIRNGKLKSASAIAWRPNESVQGELKVRFFWPFKSDYLVLALDEEYQYALVSISSAKYAWILCRTPEMNEQTFNMLVMKAEENGIDTSDLIITKHNAK